MNGFTIYKEYYDLITLLPEKEQQEILLAITKYMFEDIEPVLNDKQAKIFNNLRRPLEKSKKRSKSSSTNKSNEKQNENKMKSNEKQNENKMKSNEKQNENETKTHQDVNVIVNVNDNVNVNNLENNKGVIGEKEETKNNPTVLEETENNPKTKNEINIIKQIVNYLNLKTESEFKYTTDTTQSKINARLNEGYTLDDFIAVIDKKYNEWFGTEFEKHLNPDVLFGTKFEKYLNQKTPARSMKTEDISMSDINCEIEKEKFFDYDWLENEREEDI